MTRHSFLAITIGFSILTVAFDSFGQDDSKAGDSKEALQAPIKLDELRVWRDGGSLGFKLSDAKDHHLAFCVDGKAGSATRGFFFLNVTHPDQHGGQKLELGGAAEKRLLSYLKSWLDAEFTPEQLAAIQKAKWDDRTHSYKLTEKELQARNVLGLVGGRAKTIEGMRNVGRDRAISLANSYVAKQTWKDDYVLDAPAEVREFPAYWQVSFRRPPARQADPAFGVARVNKNTGEVTWVSQK